MAKILAFDVIVFGGGMVGMSTALALAQDGLKVAVVEPIPAPKQLEPNFDGRVCAISLGSQRLLASIGAWQHMAAHAEPITDIRVTDGHAPLFLHYDHREVGTDPFGWIVENRTIRHGLFEAAKKYRNLIIFAPSRPLEITRDAYHARALLTSGEWLQAPLLVGAEGRQSFLRDVAGIRIHQSDYGHSAIVCTIAHSLPHHGLAQERFLPVGPFAVLPMQNNRSSLVWTERHDLAGQFAALPDAELAQEIHRRIGDGLGGIRVVGPRFTYPLSLQHAERYVDARIALVGDAAHGIHPIAGQGVNLGFRDAAALAEVIAETRKLGLDIGLESTLERYARWRRFDTLTMEVVTDGLTRLFSNNVWPLKLARQAGLAAVSTIPPLKRFFMRHAMGTVGDLPKRMQKTS